MSRPANAHRVVLLTPLPLRIRLRLAAARRIDLIGAWLCDHGHQQAAGRMWRVFRMM